MQLIGASLLMCGFTFMSCSKDDDSEDGNKRTDEQASEIERGYTPPSDDIKPFVGFWTFDIGRSRGDKNSGDDGLYILYAEKKLVSNVHGFMLCDWDYNKSTSTLSMTYPLYYHGGVFDVTLSTEDSFIGTCIEKDGNKVSFSAKRISASSVCNNYLSKHYVSVNDESKELYFDLNNNRSNNILYGSALDGDTEYIKSNDLAYRAWFNEGRGYYKISYFTSTGKELSDGDTKCGDLDVIKIVSDTIKHGDYKLVNSIEIHHPYSYSQSYLKLKMYAQYWSKYEGKAEDLVKIEEISGMFKVK